MGIKVYHNSYLLSTHPVAGWTNPVEKYATVKLDHFPQYIGVKSKKNIYIYIYIWVDTTLDLDATKRPLWPENPALAEVCWSCDMWYRIFHYFRMSANKSTTKPVTLLFWHSSFNAEKNRGKFKVHKVRNTRCCKAIIIESFKLW